MRITDVNGARMLWNTLRRIKLLAISVLEHCKLKLGTGRRHEYDQSRLAVANSINVTVSDAPATIAINDGSDVATQLLVVTTLASAPAE